MTKIKNQRQLTASRNWLKEFREALREAEKNPLQLPDILHRAEMDGIQSQILALELEIAEYETLSNTAPNKATLHSLEDLPEALVRMRIIRGLTQQELAEKLNLKPQQIQRWESGAYNKATFKRLLQVMQALEFDIPSVFLIDQS
jgi:DNA-binding XRE family transcriptional regulator